MINPSDKYIRLRIWIVALGFCSMLLVIAGQAIHIQVICGPALATRATDQYETSVHTGARRGSIRDAQGRPLAVSLELTSVAAHPRQIDDRRDTARRLAAALGLKAAELQRKLSTDQPFVWVQRQVPPDRARQAEALDLKGVSYHREYSRFYPNKALAGQVLGFCDIDGKGLEGIEHHYERYLNAEALAHRALRDALGRRFGTGDLAGRLPSGNDVVLTLDAAIQHIAETTLSEAVASYQARSGMALVLEPATGAVLAMAHQPMFNPNNNRRGTGAEQWRNRIVTDRFEPGSTMKMFIAAAAIDSGAYTPNSIFFCENGAYRIGGHVVHDTKPHAWLSLANVLKYSSNIGAIKIGEGIQHAAFYQALDRFGFGARTGVDFPGETTGNLPPYERWTAVDAGAIAFGQGVSVSALQLAAAVGAIANDGVMMQPHMVREIRDANGRIIHRIDPRPVRRVVSAGSARLVRAMLASVLEPGGTGTNAALNGYTAGGKTGTAQKIAPGGGYADDRFIASFVGFAPLQQPRITVLVVIDEPRRNHYGGVVAAPVFREICQKALDYFNVPPERRIDSLILARQSEVTG